MDTGGAVMCEVDMAAEAVTVCGAESLPSQSEVCLVRSGDNEDNGSQSPRTVQVSVGGRSVQGVLLSSDQLRDTLNTTHIVIHDVHSDLESLSGLRTPSTPLTPLTPGVNSSSFNKFCLNYDDLESIAVFPVRCKNINGELHKAKFGSGGKGKCIYIKSTDEWVTPSKFESLAGRANSKDWKRSIRYGGRTLNCLIRDGVLQPHSTTCTCAACCDEPDFTGPIRLFTPHKKRRKRNSGEHAAKRANIDEAATDSNDPEAASPVPKEEKETVTTSEDSVEVLIGNCITNSETIDISTEPLTTSSIVSPLMANKIFTSPLSQNDNEQRMWWQLEEMVKAFINYGLELKQLVEQMKLKTIASREAAIQAVRLEMEEEKKQALNAARIETEMSLSRTLYDARTEKEIAVQQALHQARAEMNEKLLPSSGRHCLLKCVNCNRDALAQYTGLNNMPYCSLFCQTKDLATNKKENIKFSDNGHKHDKDKS